MSFLKDILPIMKRNSQSLERFFSSFHLFNFSTLVKRKNLSTFQLFNVSTLLVAAVCAATSVAVAANFPIGTHLVKGTLKDWQNKVLTSSAAVTVQAVATNGSVIASTTVADPSADGSIKASVTITEGVGFLFTAQGQTQVDDTASYEETTLDITIPAGNLSSLADQDWSTFDEGAFNAAGKDSDAQLKAIPQQFRLEATVNASYNLHFDAPAA